MEDDFLSDKSSVIIAKYHISRKYSCGISHSYFVPASEKLGSKCNSVIKRPRMC